MASIFEHPIERYHDCEPGATDEKVKQWTEHGLPGWEYHSRDLAYNFRVEEGYPDCPGVGAGRWAYDLPDDYEPPPVEFWIATVYSPALKRPVEDSYYPMPALHACVFKGKELAHDPNPAYANYPPERTVVMLNWFTKNAKSPEAGSDRVRG